MVTLTMPKFGRRYFGGIRFIKGRTFLVLAWFARSEAPNIFWCRYVVFRLGWPPIKIITAIRDTSSD